MSILVALIVVIVIIVVGVWFFHGSAFFSKKVEDTGPKTLNGLYNLALGRYDTALDELKRVALAHSVDVDVYIILGTLYRRRGEISKAIKINEGLIMQKDHVKAVSDIILGELLRDYRISGSTHRAEDCLQKLSGKVRTPMTYLIEAEIARSGGDYENAIKAYARFEKGTGVKCDKEISYSYVDIAENEGDSAKSIKALKSAIKHYPDNRNARFMLADKYFDDGKTDQGFKEIRYIIDNDLAKSTEHLKFIENFYYQHNKMEDLFQVMSAKIAAVCSNPIPYIFVSAYYQKKSDSAKARDVLSCFLTECTPKVAIVKAYAKAIDDIILQRITMLDNTYRCSYCGAEHNEFADICSKCGSIDTLDYM